MSSVPATSRWFSVTNDLLLDFGHAPGSISKYERWLDTLNGNTGLSYEYNGVNYTYMNLPSRHSLTAVR
jgi:hypothetical protein